MNYCLDARTATAHFPGIGRYTVNLARALAPQLRAEERLIILQDPTQPSPWDITALRGPQVEILSVPCSPFSPRQQWLLPRILRQQSAAAYHSPYYLMPYRPGVPALVTLHDLIPTRYPAYFSARQRLIFTLTVRLAARAARRIIAVSQATTRDLEQLLHIPHARITVIPEAADPAFYPRPAAEVTALRQQYNLPPDYLLYLGSNKPHKNLTRMVEAYALIAAQEPIPSLVIAGAWDDRYPQARQRAEDLALGDRVRWLGPLPEAALPALYTGATAFLFPSLHEGFGLPPLEALACGTPVACSRTSSLPEVVGDAALTFDPTSVDSIAQALHRILQDNALRADLRARSREQAARFSWERTARETLTLYRELNS